MPYIAVDLKVIEVQGPGLARALGLDLPTVLGCLSLLWHRCWSVKSDTITPLELRGYFQHPDSGALLEAFGLLEKKADGWRVKGADRYLRLAEQRSAAGKARSSSAGRSAGKFTSGSPAGSQRDTSGQPALTLNTEHRLPNVKSIAPRAPRDSDRLCAIFEEVVGTPYKWQGAKDGAAFAELQKSNSLEAIEARWRYGLASKDKWLKVRTVAQLNSKWNDLAEGVQSEVGVFLEDRTIF